LPKISVIIAAYNCEPWIRDTLDDVLRQTHRDWELLFVDDGSTDGTERVVRELMAATGDARIRYLRQPNSGGPAKPRNAGLAEARGELVAFLDHDDRWTPDKLARVAEAFLNEPALDVVCHDQRIVVRSAAGDRVARRLRNGPVSPALYRDMLLHGNRLSTSATTVRTQRLRERGGFDPALEINTVEDFDLWLRLAEHGARFKFLPDVLGDYLVHAGAMTRNREAHHARRRTVIARHLAAHPELGPWHGRILGHCDYSEARDAHASGQFGRAVRLYSAAIRQRSEVARAAAGLLLAALRVRL
jgi:glycosyltransferase involved in cell wall biosynthesis